MCTHKRSRLADAASTFTSGDTCTHTSLRLTKLTRKHQPILFRVLECVHWVTQSNNSVYPCTWGWRSMVRRNCLLEIQQICSLQTLSACCGRPTENTEEDRRRPPSSKTVQKDCLPIYPNNYQHSFGLGLPMCGTGWCLRLIFVGLFTCMTIFAPRLLISFAFVRKRLCLIYMQPSANVQPSVLLPQNPGPTPVQAHSRPQCNATLSRSL